jgi:hypothetical protein
MLCWGEVIVSRSLGRKGQLLSLSCLSFSSRKEDTFLWRSNTEHSAMQQKKEKKRKAAHKSCQKPRFKTQNPLQRSQ